MKIQGYFKITGNDIKTYNEESFNSLAALSFYNIIKEQHSIINSSMNNVYNLIQNIKRRPLMFVEEERLDYIWYFTSGYAGHSSMIKENNIINEKYHTQFPHWLPKWIKKNKDNTYEVHTYSVCEMIYEITSSEKEAVELYYELIEKFFEEIKEEI